MKILKDIKPTKENIEMLKELSNVSREKLEHIENQRYQQAGISRAIEKTILDKLDIDYNYADISIYETYVNILRQKNIELLLNESQDIKYK